MKIPENQSRWQKMTKEEKRKKRDEFLIVREIEKETVEKSKVGWLAEVSELFYWCRFFGRLDRASYRSALCSSRLDFPSPGPCFMWMDWRSCTTAKSPASWMDG